MTRVGASCTQAASRFGDVVELIKHNRRFDTICWRSNDTIEAARAGEAGRGFAGGFASEVKALAGTDRQGTGEISRPIAEVSRANQDRSPPSTEIGQEPHRRMSRSPRPSQRRWGDKKKGGTTGAAQLGNFAERAGRRRRGTQQVSSNITAGSRRHRSRIA